jgi:dipeptide/tripeptide permease
VLTGLLALHKPVLTVAVPLWVAGHTAAPRSLVSVLLVINTVLTVLLQVPLSRGVGSQAGALRVLRRSGLTLAVSCLLLAAAAGRSAGPASALLVVGVAVLTIGELWQSAGGWELSYDLAPADAQGEYQAAYSMLNGVRDSVGPVVVTAAVMSGGVGSGGATGGGAGGIGGWLALAAGFAVVGAVLGPVVGAFRPGRLRSS